MAAETRTSAELRVWRRNLYTMWVAQTLSIVGFSFTAPFLPLYLRQLGLTGTNEVIWWSGLMNVGSGLVMALSAPLWGAIADRYGRKPMVLRAMFGGAAIIGLMGFAPNVQVLLALRLIQGLLTGTVTASVALIASITPRERLGFSLGLMQTAVFTGSSLGPFIGGVSADAIGYRQSFALTGALLGAAGLLVLVLVRERFARAGGGGAGAPLFRGLFAPLSNPLLVSLTVVIFLLGASTMGIAPLLPIFVEQLAGSTRNVASLSGATFGIAGLTNALAAIAFGRLADRLGHRRILIGCSFAAALLLIPQAFVQTPWQLIAMRGIFGVATGGMMPTANALIATATPPETRGAVYGLTSASTALGSALGPLGASALAAVVSIRAVFLVTAGVMFFVGGWVLRTLGGGAGREAEGGGRTAAGRGRGARGAGRGA